MLKMSFIMIITPECLQLERFGRVCQPRQDGFSTIREESPFRKKVTQKLLNFKDFTIEADFAANRHITER